MIGFCISPVSLLGITAYYLAKEVVSRAADMTEAQAMDYATARVKELYAGVHQ
jgi:hypothetical protein